MEPQNHKTSAKDFFLNLGAIVALYTTVGSLLNLLFTVINSAFPKIINGQSSFYSPSISMPVATLIIFFPIFIILMWILEKEFVLEPEKRNYAVKRWLSFITLFIAGIILAGDLVTVLYYFLDGQEMTVGFLLKILSVLVVSLMIFVYYISDLKNSITPRSRKWWFNISVVLIIFAVIWGFTVLGSPRTQKFFKYDEQKIMGLQNLDGAIIGYYQTKGFLPNSLNEISSISYYYSQNDPQTGKSYEYILVGQSAKTYELCAEFNKSSKGDKNYTNGEWSHPAGRYCFSRSIPLNLYKTIEVR